jgi:hypothetical protein
MKDSWHKLQWSVGYFVPRLLKGLFCGWSISGASVVQNGATSMVGQCVIQLAHLNDLQTINLIRDRYVGLFVCFKLVEWSWSQSYSKKSLYSLYHLCFHWSDDKNLRIWGCKEKDSYKLKLVSKSLVGSRAHLHTKKTNHYLNFLMTFWHLEGNRTRLGRPWNPWVLTCL